MGTLFHLKQIFQEFLMIIAFLQNSYQAFPTFRGLMWQNIFFNVFNLPNVHKQSEKHQNMHRQTVKSFLTNKTGKGRPLSILFSFLAITPSRLGMRDAMRSVACHTPENLIFQWRSGNILITRPRV